MNLARGGRLVIGVVCGWLLSSQAMGQDASIEDTDPTESEATDEAEATEAETSEPSTDDGDVSGADDLGGMDEGDEDALDETAAPPPEPEPAAEASAAGAVNLDVSAAAAGPVADGSVQVDTDPEAASEESDEGGPVRQAGSHIRRDRLRYEGGLLNDSPFRVTLADQQDALRARGRTGIGVPATTAALGLGAPGTMIMLRAQVRQQPTLFLLNGRRMVSAPFTDRFGIDYIDLNQIPIQLIERTETAAGNQSALYGDSAIGGVVNFVTKRDYDGFEVSIGGQATDKFDQTEADVSVTVGAGSEKTGMNMMLSYFQREPLSAGDRDWMGERLERHESIVSHPLSFQPQLNFRDFPFADPGCAAATRAGQATDTELRIPLFGEPITRAGGNALDLLPTDTTMDPARDYGSQFGNWDQVRGLEGAKGNGILDDGQTSSYCGGDLSNFQDLIIEEERIQTYATFWHEFNAHVEGFAEVGYFRNTNQNRTPPSFPLTRLSADEAGLDQAFLLQHPDTPYQLYGFAASDVGPDMRFRENLYPIGSPLPLHAGPNINERRIDTFRAVAGLKGDFKEAGEGSVLETWDWELSGVYSVSESISRVPDVLLDRLADALGNCQAEKQEIDEFGQPTGNTVPTTIKDRQEAGCYNPFYSSVTNNIAVDPLNQSNGSVNNWRGFIDSDSETNIEMDGFGLQDGGYICDPNDPNSPPCPDEFDLRRDPTMDIEDGVYELAGMPNTRQTVAGLLGEQITQQRRSLTTVDLGAAGALVEFPGGGLSLGLGGQLRRETLLINYDADYNQRRYAFLFGAPDVDPVGRNIGAGFAEARLRVADGLLEVQGAGRVEYYENVGTAVSPMGGVALRPFATSGTPALEWLLVRGHAGLGHRAPSLMQQYGSYTEFHSVEYESALHFLPYQVTGNQNLDFEKYTTLSAGLQYDYVGFHVGADFWYTAGSDIIGADNVQTLLRDCEAIRQRVSKDCDETRFGDNRVLNYVSSPFDNLAEIETNGIDGGLSYTLDSKRRGLGDFGTFMLGVQGRYINSYLLKSPRALREYYRDDYTTYSDPELGEPSVDDANNRDYSELNAEYEAAGYRNLENFAPPLPKLRLAVPLRWSFAGHTFGATMRYIGSYYDDSESTIEKYGLTQELSAGRAAGTVPFADGEEIEAWTVFDLSYGFLFGADNWQTQLSVGVINLLDADPPAAEGAFAYDVGIHDPRGRILYARATGRF